MALKFPCPNCGKQLAAPESLVGQQRKCPNCGRQVTVPGKQPISTGAAPNDETAAPPADHPLLLFPARAASHGNLIDMTAMVDIVFFLLIFFLVTSMESLQAVINLPTLEASEGASSNLQAVPDYSKDPALIVVSIDNDDTIWVEDEEALSEHDLRSKLRAAKQKDDRDGMLVKGAGNATHGKFVMVLDAGADAGMNKILFSVDQSEEADRG